VADVQGWQNPASLTLGVRTGSINASPCDPVENFSFSLPDTPQFGPAPVAVCVEQNTDTQFSIPMLDWSTRDNGCATEWAFVHRIGVQSGRLQLSERAPINRRLCEVAAPGGTTGQPELP